MQKAQVEDILCSITHEKMQVPVLSNSAISFEFIAIARWLMDNNCADPIDLTKTISVLILNNCIRDTEIALTPEYKVEIAKYLAELKKDFPNLQVFGVDKIEGISFLLQQAIPLENRDPEIHNNRIKPKLLNAVNAQNFIAVSEALAELIGSSPGTYCVEAFHRSIILGNSEIFQLFLTVPGINMLTCFPLESTQSSIYQAVRYNRADILVSLLNAMKQRGIFYLTVDTYSRDQTLLQLANSLDAYDVMEVLLNQLPPTSIEPNQLICVDVNHYPVPIFHRAVKQGLLSLMKAFLNHSMLELYLDDDYQKTPLYLAKTCNNPEVMNVLLDHYINSMLKNPESLTCEFKTKPSSLNNLRKHRDELWERFRTVIKSDMKNQEYLCLLNNIVKPNQLKSYLMHPLHLVFSSSNTDNCVEWAMSLFTTRNILKEIQEEITQMNNTFEHTLTYMPNQAI